MKDIFLLFITSLFQPTGYDFGHGDVGEGAEEAAPEKVATANPADAAPMHAKVYTPLNVLSRNLEYSHYHDSTQAPKPQAEAAARKAQYMSTGAEPGAVNGGSIAIVAGAATTTEDVTTSMAAAVIDEKPSTNEKGASVVLLVTSMPSTTAIEGNQITLRNILNGKLKFKAVEIDGIVHSLSQ